MIIKVKATGDSNIYKRLKKMNLSKNGRLRGAYRRAVRYTVEKTWKESIRKARIRVRTGRILALDFEYPTTYTVRVTPKAEHAKFFWYGAKRSRGRWIKYIRVYDAYSGSYTKVYLGKRFRKERIQYYIQKYGERFVGWHPGISTRKFPLRKTFTELIDKNLTAALSRFVKRWVNER